MTKAEAESMGLKLRPLLAWDFTRGAAVVVKPGRSFSHLVYGVDDFQAIQLVKVDSETTPPEVILCSGGSFKGVPLRPLYFSHDLSMSKRAVPVDWEVGVSYDEYRSKVPAQS